MMAAPVSATVSDFLEMVRSDGGPENYAKVASKYEEYVKSVNWEADISACTKWQTFHADVINSTVTVPTTGSVKPHRILDAGCGTGLIASRTVISQLVSRNIVEMYGGDLCPEMLKEARAKNIYTDLQVISLKEKLPYESSFFDSIISSGVFTVGHCGAECLPNLVRVLKEGGYISLTCVGYGRGDNKKEEWKRQIKECNCELIEDNLMPYRDGLEAQEKSVVLVIRKLPA